MTSVPYPTFLHQLPVDASTSSSRVALPAVGKCRIYPESCTADSSEFRAIVDKSKEQAAVNTNLTDKEERTAAEKTKKKCMKEAAAMAKTYLTEILQLDVSIVQVELFISPNDLIDTNGCIAACFLDAGCTAIVTDGKNIKAMDMAKIPRDRLVAHFQQSWTTTSDSNLTTLEEIVAAAEFASILSVEVSKNVNFDAKQIIDILQFQSHQQEALGFQVIVQFNPADCNCESDDDLAALVATVSKTCKDGHGNITMVDPTAKQLGLSYAACMKTDRPDGLYTTVVCTRAGEALGLVYSSKVSSIISLCHSSHSIRLCQHGPPIRNLLWRHWSVAVVSTSLGHEMDCGAREIHLVTFRLFTG